MVCREYFARPNNMQVQVFANTSLPPFSSTTISFSFFTVPSRIIFDSSFSTLFWITRLIGRAPNCGSKPWVAMNRMAFLLP